MSFLVGIGVFVGIMAALAFLPAVLGRILDPINIRRVKAHCEAAGCSGIEIKAWPNHYGVSFQKNGAKHYAKCRVVGRSIKWKGKSPHET